MSIRSGFLVLSLTLGLLCAHGQTGRFLRVELEARSNSRPFSLLPLSEEGILLFYRTVEKEEDGSAVWLFQLYDNELKESWKVEFPISGRMSLVDFLYADSLVRILFTGRLAGEASEKALIIEISSSGSYFMPVEVPLPDRYTVSSFSFVGKRYVIGLNDKRFDSQVLIVNSNAEFITLQPGLKGESWLDDVAYHTQTGQYLLLFRNRSSRKQSGLVAMAYDRLGNRIWTEEIAENKNLSATVGRWLINRGSIAVLGAYSNETRTASFATQSPEVVKASGLFSVKIQQGRQKDMVYYPFNEFTNFFSHLTYNEIYKMRSARKTQGASVEFNIMLSHVREDDGEHLLLAEAFFPKYHYITRMSYDYYGRPVPTTYSVFDGYQYTNAFIAGFDTAGVKAWDNNFPFKNLISMTLRPRVDLFKDGKEIIIAYFEGGRIASQVIRKAEVTGLFDYADVEGADPGKRVVEHMDETIQPWYGNFLVCSGYQKMRSLDSALGDRRFVFYFTKVAYR